MIEIYWNINEGIQITDNVSFIFSSLILLIIIAI